VVGHFNYEIASAISFVNTTDPSAPTVKQQLDANRPISVGIAWFGGNAHNVAITGYNCFGDGTQPLLTIQDPFYGWSIESYWDFLYNYLGEGYWYETWLTQP